MTDGDNLELKKRSRRRLVGAAALALLAAIILPMVMDDEPGVPAQDIQVIIPDRDADSTLARPISGRPGAPTQFEPEVAPSPQEQAPASAAARSAPESVGSAVPTVKSNAVPTPSTPSSGGKSASGKGSGVETGATTAPTPPPNGEAARVKAILEGKGASVARSTQSFVVQIGAFSENAKAVAISTDIKERGFAAFTEQAGAVTRVRVGPFDSRDEAEKAAARLANLGFNGVVATR